MRECGFGVSAGGREEDSGSEKGGPRGCRGLKRIYSVSNRVDAPKDRFISAYFDLENE